MQFRTLTDDELLLHVDNLPDSLASPLVRELASRLRRGSVNHLLDQLDDARRDIAALQARLRRAGEIL